MTAAKCKSKYISGMIRTFRMVSQKLLVVINLTRIPWNLRSWIGPRNWSIKRTRTLLKRSKRKELVMIWGERSLR